MPQLGLPALKTKVDTGACASALHAFEIKLSGPATKPNVRFLINPIHVRPDLAIACSATIHDPRDVTSSNVNNQARHVILSLL
ncbi:RimK/LysX family protein [Paracoccaceae bacterium]|nr:RimK/LysX family protein [Paracoccaceae bacterium]